MPVLALTLTALVAQTPPASPPASPPAAPPVASPSATFAPPLATPVSPSPSGPPAPPLALPTEGPVAALIKTCAPDWVKFCQSPPATTTETVRQCFTENFDKLSEPCQSGIMAMLGGAGSPG